MMQRIISLVRPTKPIMLFKMMNTKNTACKQYLALTAITVEQLLNILQIIRVKVVVQWGEGVHCHS